MGLNPFMMDAIIYLLFAKPSLAELLQVECATRCLSFLYPLRHHGVQEFLLVGFLLLHVYADVSLCLSLRRDVGHGYVGRKSMTGKNLGHFQTCLISEVETMREDTRNLLWSMESSSVITLYDELLTCSCFQLR